MGNQPSLPEQVYQAVQRNNITEFQSLAGKFGELAARDPMARQKVLEYQDKVGRTPLLVAASKNHHQIAAMLLQHGADLHYINTSSSCPGGALHEAAAKRHEGMVELLLAAGASPWAANAQGRTALDEAVLAGNINVVRRIERHAIFAGEAAVKTSGMGGLTSKYKPRWVVMMPFQPLAKHGQPPHPVRRCLWIYKDASSVSPRCRLWLDGAQAFEGGPARTDGTLRLHTSHGQPVGDIVTKFDRGYCLFLRPANQTEPAAEQFHRLISLINALPPRELPTRVHMAPPPGHLVTPPASAQPSMSAPSSDLVVQPPAFYPAIPNAGAPNSASNLLFPVTLPPVATPVATPVPTILPPPPASALPPPVAPAFPHGVGPLTAHATGHTRTSSITLPTPGGRSSPPLLPLPLPAPRASPNRTISEPSLAAATVPNAHHGDFADALSALPGESDEEFASRLASAIGAGAPCMPSRPSSLSPIAASSSVPGTQPARLNSTGHERVEASAPPLTAAVAGGALDMAAVANAASVLRPPMLSDEDLCVICLSSPKQVGFLHGTTVHKCVCRECATRVAVNTPCPLCREPVERVLGVY